jgi:hypothetical protein
VHSLRLAIRRSSAQSGLLVTVGAVALVLTALVVGLTGYLDFSATANARSFLSDAAPTANSLRVETKLGDDPAAQSAAADALFSRELAGIPVTITRTLTDFPLPAARDGARLSLPDGREARVTPASDDGLESSATLVDGTWPGAASGDTIPGALQVDAAKLLGLGVGDVLELGTADSARSVTIVGTWSAKDSDDQRWFSDPGVATGSAVAAGDGTPSFGPLMVDEAALATLGPIPFVHWTIAVDARRVTPSELERLGAVANSLRQDIIDDKNIGKGDILVDGALGGSVRTIENALGAVRGVTPVGILLVAIMGLITLAQLARLLSLARRPEIALLRSRGASGRWLTVTGVVEAVVVAVIGCALGFAAGAGLLSVLYGAGAAALAEGVYAVLVATAVVVLFGTTALRDAVRISRRDTIDDSGRRRTAATIGTAVLALAAAGIAVWQSLLYGSPLVTNAAGQQVVDPLAVVAPTLALVAIALTVLVAFGPLTDAWQRFATRRRGLQPSYSARQVARGLGTYAVAVLVIVLAVGGLTVASAYSGTWASLAARSGELSAGADVRIDLSGDPQPVTGTAPPSAADYLSLDGVTAAAPVLTTPVTMGSDDTGRLTAVPSTTMADIVSTVGGAVDVGAMASALSPLGTKGIGLPDGTTSLSIDLGFTKEAFGGEPGPPVGSVRAALWLMNPDGGLVLATIPEIVLTGDTTTLTKTIPVPADGGPWQIVAIDYAVQNVPGDGWLSTTFDNLSASAGGGAVEKITTDFTNWWAQMAPFGGGWDTDHPDSLTGTLGTENGQGRAFLRFMPVPANVTIAGGSGFLANLPPDPIPFVVNEELAAHYGVAKGDSISVRWARTGLVISGEVAGIAPLIPGIQSPYSVLVDLPSLSDFILRSSESFVPGANQLWLATSGPVDADSLLPPGAEAVTVQDAGGDQSFSRPAELALWIAAAGCLLLAVISLASVVLTIGRSRRGEVVVLRAVGLSARQQSAARLREVLSVVGLAVLFGLLSGAAVSWLTIVGLAKSAVVGVPPGLQGTLQVALVAGGELLAAAIVVMLLIALRSSSRVRHQALDTDERLETR